MQIDVKNVSFTYLKNTIQESKALDDVSYTIFDNDFLAIVGETGSGKSTLVQMLNGLMTPDSGTIKVGDKVITNNKKANKKLKELKREVGLVFQFPEHQLFEETVEKDVAFGLTNFGVAKEEALDQARKTLLSLGLDSSYFTKSPFDLSGGEKRRVAIAGILTFNPKVIVLDEPTAGLDNKGQKTLIDLLNKLHKEGKTIVVISHDMSFVMKYCNRAIVLDKGNKVFEGTTKELMNSISDFPYLEMPKLYEVASKLGVDIKNINSLKDVIDEYKKGRNNG